MQRIRQGSRLVLVLLAAFFVLVSHQSVRAVTSTSPNFEASEAEFGAGAALETCSGTYCAQASIGDTSGVDGSSATFTAAFGPLSSDSEPMLEVMIEPGQANLGVLRTDQTASRMMRIHVRSHLAGGYMIQMTGEPPRYGDHMLQTPSVATVSTPGSEQFALNAVANAIPQVGEDPIFTQGETMVEDVIQPKYATSNLFAYASGDIIAQTSSESSQIRYTISMIINVAGSTPAGHYTGDFSAVVTPVF